MATERYLVTGALGCIGAWTVKRLIGEGQAVWTYDLGGSKHRLELIMDTEALAQVQFISGDITDTAAFERTVADNGITHIIHLAALQIPLVRANPVQGAHVNVVGMANVLEVARRHASQIRGLAYASSVAVYGPPGQPTFQTVSLYGIHKQAKEGMARIYWNDYGLRSIGLRPHTVYGPGRDQGMTSAPTKAMLAAAAGRAYQIAFGGQVLYQHADDMAVAFIQAARSARDGAYVFDLGGTMAAMSEVVAAIEAAAPDIAGKITFDDKPLPVSCGADESEAVIGKTHWMPLVDGVKATVEHFRAAIRAGKVDVERGLA
jgi:nucleoside-diphosphate-sugar epimerase